MDTIAYVSPRYLSCAETAKLLRAALRREFPGTKFSVRSSTYAGGASINVDWTDGPTSDAVDAVAQQYAGAQFDGMVDLKTYCQHWLNPDGTVTLGHAPASGGYQTEVIGDPEHPAAELVRLGADFVIVQRESSEEWRSEIAEDLSAILGRTVSLDRMSPDWNASEWVAVVDGEIVKLVERADGWGRSYLSDIVHRYTRATDRREGGRS